MNPAQELLPRQPLHETVVTNTVSPATRLKERFRDSCRLDWRLPLVATDKASQEDNTISTSCHGENLTYGLWGS